MRVTTKLKLKFFFFYLDIKLQTEFRQRKATENRKPKIEKRRHKAIKRAAPARNFRLSDDPCSSSGYTPRGVGLPTARERPRSAPSTNKQTNIEYDLKDMG